MEAGAIRVALADDSAELRGLLRAVLEDDGRFVVVGEAGDGDDAVELARSARPDAIVLDLAMPFKGGLAAIADIRAVAPETRILVLSAYASPPMTRKAMQRGADRCVQKSGVGWILEVPNALATPRRSVSAPRLGREPAKP